MDPIRKVLSLDGGGALAGMLAVALGRLYGQETPGREIVREFDVVAGNSGGSIVLTALCCNYTPGEIASFYRHPPTVRSMFSPRWSAAFKSIPPLRVLFPPYSAAGKFAALKALFDKNQRPGESPPSSIRMSEWPGILGCDVNLLVTAYDYDTERGVFFRSNEASPARGPGSHASPTLAEAVHASTNAPVVQFDAPAEVGKRRYWDGGLAGYNNPVLAAVVEAMANFPGEVANLRVLSLGTGTFMRAATADGAAPPLGAPPAGTGLLTALTKAGRAVIADPPGAATFHAYMALGHRLPGADGADTDSRLVRMCPFVRPIFDARAGDWATPRGLTDREFECLVDLPSDAMEAHQLALVEKMGNLWIAGDIPNQPIRMGVRMACDIGDDTFAAAHAHWQRITA
jgi:uncharacterized protein